MPVSMAFLACSIVIAGSMVISLVPFATCLSHTPSALCSMPTSMGKTSAFTALAILHTELLPFAAFAATIAVTSLPVWVTPCATTPLSEQNMATALFDISTFALPVSAAIRIISSSSMPRLDKGFAILSHRFLASVAASLSGSCILSLSCRMYSAYSCPVTAIAQASPSYTHKHP